MMACVAMIVGEHAVSAAVHLRVTVNEYISGHTTCRRSILVTRVKCEREFLKRGGNQRWW
jgi:hypothetical protein